MFFKFQVTQANLNKILREHKQWRQTGGWCGKVADLTDTDISDLEYDLEELVGAYIEGVVHSEKNKALLLEKTKNKKGLT